MSALIAGQSLNLLNTKPKTSVPEIECDGFVQQHAPFR